MHNLFPSLLYPHHMILVWLLYIVLAVVMLIFLVDLIIVLILIRRIFKQMLNIESNIHDLALSIVTNETGKFILEEVRGLRALALELLPPQPIVNTDDSLLKFVLALTPDQKELLRSKIFPAAKLESAATDTNHSGYTETELDAPASLNAGIPINKAKTVRARRASPTSKK